MKLNLTQRFAGSLVAQIMGRVIVVGLALVTVALVTRYLGPEGYGHYATAFALVNLVGLAIDLGLYLVIVRVLSSHERRPEEVVAAVIGLRLALFAASFLAIALATLVLPYDSATKSAILVGSLSLLGITLNQALGGIFQARLRMDLFVLGDILGRLATLLLAWALLLGGYGLIGVAWAVVAGYAFNLALTFSLARPYLKLGVSFDFRVWRWLLREGVPLGILIVLTALYLRLDVFLLSLFRPAAEVGPYGVAAKVAEVLAGFGLILMSGVLPVLSAYRAERSQEKVARVASEAYDLLLAVGLGLVVGGVFAAPGIVDLVAGEGFESAVLPLQILLGAVALGFLTTFYGQLMVAYGEQRRLVRPTLAAVGLSLAAGFIMIPLYGALGAAWALIAAELILLAGYRRASFPVTGFRPPEGRTFKLFVSLLVFTTILFALRAAPLFWMLLPAVVGYAGSLLALGVISPERVRELRGVVK